MEASLICASAPGAETRERIATEHGIKVFADNAEAVKGADVVVLAVKPQMMKSVCQALKASLDAHQLIVSVAAGITCASLTQWLGDQPVVRCMPNTPSLLRQGASGLYATEKVSPTQREQAEQLLSAVGVAVWVEQEKHMDAVTAVSGSGPAYFFLMMEAMTAAGVKLGLPEDIAKKTHAADGAGLGADRHWQQCGRGRIASSCRLTGRDHRSCDQGLSGRRLRGAGRNSTGRRRPPRSRAG